MTEADAPPQRPVKSIGGLARAATAFRILPRALLLAGIGPASALASGGPAPMEWAGPLSGAVGLILGAMGAVVGVGSLLRARRVRDGAEARIREADLLLGCHMSEMARHRKTQDLLVQAVEQSPSGILLAYADRSRAPLLNTQALRILGLSEPPPAGSLPDDRSWLVYTAAGRRLERAEMPLARALRHGQTIQNEELRLVLASGQERWILTNAAPVRDASGRVAAGIVVFHDITSSRQAERELARFKFFLEAGVEEVYLVRPDGVMAYVNDAVARSLGRPRAELVGAPLTAVDPAYGPEAVQRLLHTVRRGPYTFLATQRCWDGRALLKEIKAFYMRFGDEEFICAFGQDVTERTRLEGELVSTRALFEASLSQAPWGVIIGDAATGCVSIANAAAAEMLGLAAEDLIGMEVNGHQSIWTFLDEDGQALTPGETPLGRAVFQGESTSDLEVRFVLEGRAETWLMANAAPVRDATGKVVAGILVMADISRRKRMERQMIHKAQHDALTGLPNRESCLGLLGEALARGKASLPGFAVAFVDLDRFKMLNDSLGHAFGDQVLMQAAARLSRCVEGFGSVCRFGGDEFVLLVDRAADAAEAQDLVRQALDELSRPMELEGHELRLTASAGVVLGPTPDSTTAESILQNADLAMHRAKDSGRDRVRLFHPGMLRRAQELLSLDADLRWGLALGEFEPFFQPIVSADGARLLGFEALARWRSPTRGLVLPTAFIPHAEESGLIMPLGALMLRRSCEVMTAWRRRFPAARSMTLAVNLSARQFGQADLVDSVRHVLRETGLPPALLKLELTESTLMVDPEGALSVMRRLKALGLSLAIDDFGTGYSSLAYLQRFPVDVLKIDRSFVKLLPRGDADSLALVQTVAALAGSLRLSMVGEGVETEEQRSLLASVGCQAMQGYLFSPPLSAPDMEALLAVYEATGTLPKPSPPDPSKPSAPSAPPCSR